MKRHRFLAASIFGLTLCQSFSGRAAPFSASDLELADRLTDAAMSPDGRSLAYVRSRVDSGGKERVETVCTQSVEPTETDRACLANAPEGHLPQWAADNRTIYMLSDRGGSTQVWRWSPSGQAVQVTHLPLDVSSFRLTPDGSRLVVSMAVFLQAEQPSATRKRLDTLSAQPSSGRIYDRLFVRHWNAWDDGTRNHLFVLRLNRDGTTAGEPVPLMPSLDADVPARPDEDGSDWSISPDGRSIYFSAKTAGRADPWSTDHSIYRVPIDASERSRTLVPSDGVWEAGPVPSPDGHFLAFRATSKPGSESDRFGITIVDLRSGQVRTLAPNWDRSTTVLQWSQDGRSLLAIAEDDGQARLFTVDVSSGRATALTQGGHVTASLLAGSIPIVTRDDSRSPSELWRVDAPGRATRLTSVGLDRSSGRTLPTMTRFTFAGWNGDVVHGSVFKPDGFVAGRRYPVIFIVHGGPEDSFDDKWSYLWDNPQVYAGLGYAIVGIDFHGSVGYGQAFTDSIADHWGDRPLEDLRKGWTAALKSYAFLDPQRACAIGASYGGYMVNWMAGVWNSPWRCLVASDGPFDDRTMGFTTDELWFAEWEHGGTNHTPWTDPAAYSRFNPADHVASWRVPELVVHGEKDYRVPLDQGLGAFDALQRRGIDSRLLVFPDEGHIVLKPADSLLWYAVTGEWLRAHLGPS